MSRRAWFRVHSFAGMFGGLLLFVVCWSGTFASVSTELDWLLNPALRASGPHDSIDWAAAEAAALSAGDGSRVQWIAAPAFSGAAIDVVVNRPQQRFVHVYVDPVTYAVRGATSYFNVQRFFRDMHMALFLPYPVGTYLVGLLGIFLVVSSVTPLVFYKRWWQRFLQFRAGHDRRAFFSELHKITGLWTLWFVLLIGLTGVWYLVEQLSIDIADAQFVYPASPKWHDRQGSRLPLNELVAAAQRARPELDARMISLDGDLIVVTGQAGNVLVRDRANALFLDPVEASIPSGAMPTTWAGSSAGSRRSIHCTSKLRRDSDETAVVRHGPRSVGLVPHRCLSACEAARRSRRETSAMERAGSRVGGERHRAGRWFRLQFRNDPAPRCRARGDADVARCIARRDCVSRGVDRQHARCDWVVAQAGLARTASPVRKVICGRGAYLFRNLARSVLSQHRPPTEEIPWNCLLHVTCSSSWRSVFWSSARRS